MCRTKQACGRLGRALIAITGALFLCGSMVHAQGLGPTQFDRDLPGMDYDSIGFGASVGNDTDEIAHCRRACELDPRCMAVTWVRRDGDVPGKCLLKASSRIFGINVNSLPQVPNTATAVKTYPSSSCWARHIFNLKFCNVFPAGESGNSGTSVTLECPPGSVPASLGNQAIPGRFDRFCVARLANDPGGLPNCTDAFGGVSNEAGVLGNSVNHACLDVP